MDSVSANHYEQQLYTVFKSFDVDNEEALDKVAVLDLCDALQLEDRGVTLANTLFERQPDRITFEQFRNGLLSVLSGGERSGESAQCVHSVTTTSAAPAPSDEDSGREVAPKFVFGTKKYGRRSRPQRVPAGVSGVARASSVSRLDADERRHRLAQRARYRRSASAMDSRDVASTSDEDDVSGDPGPSDLDHDQRIDYEQALALCRNLHMDSIDRAVVERIFEDTRDTTVGEFFDRLNVSLTSSIEGVRDLGEPNVGGGDIDDVDEDSAISIETIIEEWERAGVSQPHRQLLRLGFVAPMVPLAELEAALGTSTGSAAAALTVVRMRLSRARRRADRAAAERDRARADLTMAERRAQLLAADMDETQARNEARLEERVRRSEARHAEGGRRAAEEAAAERERAADLATRLGEEKLRRVELEARARADLDVERSRVAYLEERLVAAEERATVAERLAAAQAAEMCLVAENPPPVPSAEEKELRAALLAATLELRRLRDREDELTAALSRAVPVSPRGNPPCEDLSEELRTLLNPDDDPPQVTEDKPPTCVLSSPRNMNVNQILLRLQSVSENINMFSDYNCETCSGGIGAIKTEVQKLVDLLSHIKFQNAEIQTDPPEDGAALADINFEEDRRKYLEIIRELEESLELMREEYERCEEYWTRKLQEERAEQEAERRASDERLAALLRRVADCERRFTLPPIPEREALEAQVAALEREHEEQVAALQREHSAQLAAARQREQRARPRPCTCAESTAALVARAARADAALRRLGARLRAADTLVADLYIENCRLQHRAPPR